MHITGGSYAQAIHWLPRHGGSACAPRLAVRFLIGHGPQGTGEGRRWPYQGEARRAEKGRGGGAAGVVGRGVLIVRRAASTTAWGGLRVCGGSGGWQGRRKDERHTPESLPGGVP